MPSQLCPSRQSKYRLRGWAEACTWGWISMETVAAVRRCELSGVTPVGNCVFSPSLPPSPTHLLYCHTCSWAAWLIAMETPQWVPACTCACERMRAHSRAAISQCRDRREDVLPLQTERAIFLAFIPLSAASWQWLRLCSLNWLLPTYWSSGPGWANGEKTTRKRMCSLTCQQIPSVC